MIIGIFPFLVAFLWVSPSKTIVFYGGMFILMILWTAIDTFMDMQYQAEAYNMFAQMRKQSLGFQQMFDIPNIAADAVSLYGQGRWLSLGLATAISSAITGANNYALSAMGSQLSATAQSAAATGAQNIDSAGQAKLAEDAGKDLAYRQTLAATSMPNFMAGIGSYEAQKLMSNINTGTGMSNTFGGNAGAAGAMSGKTVGGYAGESALSNAMGFSDLGSYSQWKSSSGSVTQGMADSMAKHGLSPSIANAMVGLKLDTNKINLNADGSIGNVQATGIKDDGKNYSVSESSIEARHRVMGESENTAGLNIPNGGSVTEVFDKNGNLTQIGIEGGGFSRYNKNLETGYTMGTHAYEKDGIQYTANYKGAGLELSFIDKTGDSVTRDMKMNTDGSYQTVSTTTDVGANGLAIGDIQFQAGSKVMQSMDGVTEGGGVFNIGDREFKGSITTNADGMVMSVTGSNGQRLSQEDVDNINKERMKTTQLGESYSIVAGSGFDFDSKAITQSVASGNGDLALQVVSDLYHDAKDWGNYLKANGRATEFNNYQENYEKALAAYTTAAAQGLSNFGNITSIEKSNESNSHNASYTNANSYNAGGGINISGGIGFNWGVSDSIQEKTSDQFAISNSNEITQSRNELELRIRNVVTSGLKEGLNTDEINKKMNDIFQ